MRQLVHLGILAFSFVSAAGCGRDLPLFSANPADGLRIVPEDLDLFRGQEFRFDVILDLANTTSSVLGREGLELELAPSELASISPEGRGRTQRAGNGLLVARFGGFEASAGVAVRDASLASLRVEPTLIQLRQGEQAQLTVVGQLTDGSEIDLSSGTSGTSYVSGDEAIVRPGEDGALLGIGIGSTPVFAQNLDQLASVGVEVVETVLAISQIVIEPNPIQLGVGGEGEFTVLGVRADGSQVDLTNDAAVEVTLDREVAFVVAPGRLGAVRTGEATLTARLGDLSGSAAVVVEDSEFIGLEVRPSEITLDPGESATFRVIGLRPDGQEVDVTDDARVRYPGATRTLSIEAGVVEAFSASLAETFPITLGALEAPLTVIVRGPMPDLVRIEAVPPRIELREGETAPVLIIGFFTDGTSRPVNDEAILVSRNQAIAVLEPGSLVRGVGEGETTLGVAVGGLSLNVVVAVSATSVTVVGLQLTPPSFDLQVGEVFLGVRLLALFSDGSTQEVTFSPETAFGTTNAMIARWTGMGLLAVGEGNAVLQATFRGLRAQAPVLVRTDPPPPLVRIQLLAGGSLSLMQTSAVQVVGFFADGTQADVTGDPGLTLQSSDAGVVATAGTALVGVSVGRATITASLGGFSDSLEVVVRSSTNEVLTGLEWRPASLTVSAGSTATTTLIATYSSGRTEDLWINPNAIIGVMGPVAVLRANGVINVTGQAVGMATVQATFQGRTASLQVTVQGPNPTVTGITLGVPAQLEVGATTPFSIVANLSDGTTRDISSDPGLALTVLPPGIIQLSGGTVRAQATGTAVLSARYQGFGTVERVTVIAAVDPIVGVEWQPSTLDIQVNQSSTVRLFSVRQSGLRTDVTLDPRVNAVVVGPITLDASSGVARVRGTGAGAARIDATFQGFSTRLDVTVRNPGAAVTFLILQLATIQIEVGRTQTFRVIARFADGTSRDVTNDPGLSVSVLDTSVLQLASPGVVRGVAVGQTQLQATFGGRGTQRSLQVVAPSVVTSLFFTPGQLVLPINQSRSTRLFASRQGLSSLNVSTSTEATLTASGPVSLVRSGNSIQVTATGNGTGTITASFRGFTTTLRVAAGNAPRVIRIDITPASPFNLNVGATQNLVVTALLSNGTTENLTNAASFQDATLPSQGMPITVSGAGVITGIASGQGRVVVRAGGFTRLVTVNVNAPAPQITSLTPNRIPVGAPPTTLVIAGSGFTGSDRIFVNGTPVVTTFVNVGQLRFSNAGPLFQGAGNLSVQVRGTNGLSNVVILQLGSGPQITSSSPTQILANMTLELRLMGTGLDNLSYSGTGLSFSGATSGGTSARVDVTTSAMVSPGPVTITVSNSFGSDTFTLAVVRPTGSLNTVSGDIRNLSGTNAFTSVDVASFSGFTTSGADPVVILSAGDVTFRTNSGILLAGSDGGTGGANGGDGGNAGSGGSGGGGGGDGDDPTPASGGSGSPAGSAAARSAGRGTSGGAGGGVGAGQPGAVDCAAGGGGGALGGDGGAGGGDLGAGTGGAGGVAGAGSDFGGGTGGGGGSTCGLGGGTGGGGGGGVLVIQVANGRTIRIDGEIIASGGAGGTETTSAVGGGGGGSGGRVELRAPSGTIIVGGNIRAQGGNGGIVRGTGDGGGGGGGGVIVLEASTLNAPSARLRVDGGSAGTSSSGSPGRVGQPGRIERNP